jgi:hypothetical protein
MKKSLMKPLYLWLTRAAVQRLTHLGDRTTSGFLTSSRSRRIPTSHISLHCLAFEGAINLEQDLSRGSRAFSFYVEECRTSLVSCQKTTAAISLRDVPQPFSGYAVSPIYSFPHHPCSSLAPASPSLPQSKPSLGPSPSRAGTSLPWPRRGPGKRSGSCFPASCTSRRKGRTPGGGPLCWCWPPLASWRRRSKSRRSSLGGRRACPAR